MTRRHAIAVAKVIRDTNAVQGADSRLRLAEDMADAIEPIAKNFDRDLFIAYATSASPE